MKEYFMRLVIGWLVQYLTKEKIKEWADNARNWIIPFIRDNAQEVIRRLRVEAQKTENQLDDAGVDALEEFIDALLPDTASTL